MSKHISEVLMERRKELITEAREIAEKGVTFNRDLSANEQERFDSLMAEAQALEGRAKAIKDGEAAAHDLERSFRERTGHTPGLGASDDAEVVDALRSLILENNPRPVVLSAAGERSHYSPGVEARAMSTTSPSGMQSTSFYGRVFESAVANSSVLSAGATVIRTDNGEDLKVSRSTARSTATIVTEAGAIGESDPSLDSVTLKAYKQGFLITVSREFVDDSAFDVAGYLARQAGEAIGAGLNGYVLNGTGSGQPTGVVGEALVGVTGPTGTATSLGDQANAGEGTDLITLLAASVPAAYLRSPATGFLLQPSTLAALENLKSSTGELVGSQFVAGSRYPYYVDDDVPAMAANAKSVLFGDWSRCVVRLVGGIRFERSDDFKFDSDEVCFRALLRFDSRLVNTDAVRYFANSAS